MKRGLEGYTPTLLGQSSTCQDRDKYWVTDPTGIMWETFHHTLDGIPVYGEDTAVFNHGESVVPTPEAESRAGCCVPEAKEEAIAAGSSCCDA